MNGMNTDRFSKKALKRWRSGILSALFFLGSAFCLEGLETLDLKGCVQEALKGNYGLRISRVEASSAAQGFQIARAAFDPVFSFGYQRGFSQSPTANTQLDGALVPQSENDNFSGGISQFLISGGTLSLQTGASRFETNSSFALLNPSYDANLRVGLRQPLLRGIGVARLPLQTARLELVAGDLRMRQAVLQTLAALETAYWQLGLSRLTRSAQARAVETSRSLMQEVEVRVEAGLANGLDRLRGETALASEGQRLLVAEQEEARAGDELVRHLGRQEFEGVVFVGNEAFASGALGIQTPDSDEVLKLAETVEPEYLLARQAAYRSDLRVKQARNDLLPRLDMVASGASLGRSGEYGAAYDRARERDGYQWSLGVELNVPWGLRQERARLQQAKNELQVAELSAGNARQRLVLLVRDACRGVLASRRQMEASEASLKLSREQADQLRIRYEQGLAEFRDILEARNGALQAEVTLYRSRFAAVRAEIEVARLSGRLLERHQIKWK
jgi:outer membrane protein TolC